MFSRFCYLFLNHLLNNIYSYLLNDCGIQIFVKKKLLQAQANQLKPESQFACISVLESNKKLINF